MLRMESRAPYAGGAVNARVLVAETGEFRLVLADESEQFYTQQSEQARFFKLTGPRKHDSQSNSTTPLAAENTEGEMLGNFEMGGKFGAEGAISGIIQSLWGGYEEHVGTFSMTYFSTAYESTSRLEYLLGTYGTNTDSMTINAEGMIFYQSAASDCTGNGRAQVIDPNYNMYRIEIEVGNCTVDFHRNGRTFTGLAYIEPNTMTLDWRIHRLDTRFGRKRVVRERLRPISLPQLEPGATLVVVCDKGFEH